MNLGGLFESCLACRTGVTRSFDSPRSSCGFWRFSSVIPFAGSLFAAANDHFAFISAGSGPGVGQGGAGDAGGQDLHVPVGKLESTLEMIAKDLKMLLCQDAPHEPDA